MRLQNEKLRGRRNGKARNKMRRTESSQVKGEEKRIQGEKVFLKFLFFLCVDIFQPTQGMRERERKKSFFLRSSVFSRCFIALFIVVESVFGSCTRKIEKRKSMSTFKVTKEKVIFVLL